MRRVVFVLLIFCSTALWAFNQTVDYDQWLNKLQTTQQIFNELGYTLKLSPKSCVCNYEVHGRDTLFLYVFNDFYCFPPMKFMNKKQENFYWKTVRDVKKVLPYARLVSRTVYTANQQLEQIHDEAERKAFLKKTEKELFKRYEKEMRAMSINQGKLLVRLVDRECHQTTYSIIKTYKGAFKAWMWQTVARLFGSDLKAEYDVQNKDKIIERVITLVEAGQL
ncbi:MAG: putative lipoprotein [Bacteroidetes bacterium]|jgi:hypothetical protein|nr:putative lipoprotein [Bacteroidota bacterium]